MFKKIAKIKIIALTIFTITACGATEVTNNQNSSDDRLNVVTTTTIIANLTEEIGGEKINHTGILPRGSDPHVYEPVPQDNITLENADLVIYNGYDLEPNLIRLINSSGLNAKTLAVGELVPPLDFEEEGQMVPDPHVWGNVENVIIMVEGIRDKLVELKPDGQEIFSENAETLIQELQELHIWIQEQIDTIPPSQRQLITTHDAFQYYGVTYGLEIPGTLIGISTEEQPSAQTVRDLVETIRIKGVRAIFAETTINPTLIETVAQEAGIEVAPTELYSDSLGAENSPASTYIGMMRANTETIVNALSN
ncbi:metal ABC transporter solute-binding protein, Zn/Mn family [Cyanobacterium sp. IPPAS B-1200]|uniref:metal ABC transporter solute-binding protein, Zn/Mn family n=1 Tax=Cyanobacterium sp. IPPAS B-1200 TaxID=1562720 RepID=UPI0008528588|nr:zinc ABC transporter substrate-binding protein [Cyanobacterium sp. IPPAS B-1200]OEJ77350.1 manganese ABC transporter substrate-binding protein [Cyanobacterium sp. IPPAS B-1200]